jgi:hypothetical protein
MSPSTSGKDRGQGSMGDWTFADLVDLTCLQQSEKFGKFGGHEEEAAKAAEQAVDTFQETRLEDTPPKEQEPHDGEAAKRQEDDRDKFKEAADQGFPAKGAHTYYNTNVFPTPSHLVKFKHMLSELVELATVK